MGIDAERLGTAPGPVQEVTRLSDAWLRHAVMAAIVLLVLHAVEGSWWPRAVEFAPFLIGFAAPVLLLLAAYLGLGRYVRQRTDAL